MNFKTKKRIIICINQNNYRKSSVSVHRGKAPLAAWSLTSLWCIPVAGGMEFALEHLQPDDGVHDDDKDDEQGYVEQWDHGCYDRIQDDLQTFGEGKAKMRG